MLTFSRLHDRQWLLTWHSSLQQNRDLGNKWTLLALAELGTACWIVLIHAKAEAPFDHVNPAGNHEANALVTALFAVLFVLLIYDYVSQKESYRKIRNFLTTPAGGGSIGAA